MCARTSTSLYHLVLILGTLRNPFPICPRQCAYLPQRAAAPCHQDVLLQARTSNCGILPSASDPRHAHTPGSHRSLASSWRKMKKTSSMFSASCLNFCSLSRNASSVRLRSVMSVEMPSRPQIVLLSRSLVDRCLDFYVNPSPGSGIGNCRSLCTSVPPQIRAGHRDGVFSAPVSDGKKRASSLPTNSTAEQPNSSSVAYSRRCNGTEDPSCRCRPTHFPLPGENDLPLRVAP